MKTYNFIVMIKPDENRWLAYSPALEHLGGATWDYTKEEAWANIYDVLKMTVASMIAHGEPIPEVPVRNSDVTEESQITITI